MKKYIITGGVILVAGFAIWQIMPGKTELSYINMSGNSSTTTPTPKPLSTKETKEKDAAWAVLQSYIAFAKAKDITGVTSLSYQLSPSCKEYTKNEDNKKDCDTKMENVANIGSQLEKEKLTNVWYDDKQIILSSQFTQTTEKDVSTSFQQSAFFVKKDGAIKILNFTNAKGVILLVGSSTPSEMIERLNKATRDADKDGLPDAEDTDPNKRDVDGNGFWDGIQAVFYK
jgi:carboxypeptidase C (cathepsin A)